MTSSILALDEPVNALHVPMLTPISLHSLDTC